MKRKRNTELPVKKERKKPFSTPQVWDDTIPERAYRLCLLGLKNSELALSFGVTEDTIEKWTKRHPEFRRALKKGREEADGKVVQSLYKRAIGFEHDDVYITAYKGEVVITPIKKYYPPDVTAAIFWLKNRQRDKWADVWKMEFEGNINFNDEQNNLEDLTDEELQVLRKYSLIQYMENNDPKAD